jgi:hypothetical protein
MLEAAREPTLEEVMHGYMCACGEERVFTTLHQRIGESRFTRHGRETCYSVEHEPPRAHARPRESTRVPRFRLWRGMNGGQSVRRGWRH